MAESSKEGCAAKWVRRKELTEASDLLHVNCRYPRQRINKNNSSPG